MLIYIIAFLIALFDDSEVGSSRFCEETFLLAWAEEIMEDK